MLIRTFLVEDRAEIRDTLVEAMEEIAPVKFVGHADSEAAARLWLGSSNGNWDLAIVGLFLADGSGFEVLKDCQTRKPGQKVVVLTSYGPKPVLQRCRELGADEVFDKSTEVEKLQRYCQACADSMTNQAAPLA